VVASASARFLINVVASEPEPSFATNTYFNASPITISGIIQNLVPVTLGNIVGGAGLVVGRSIG
jgi:formate/nitrite transporter FocA (FNT family)